jgi:hypothetical protein
MVSKLYKANEFYERQKAGKIATPYKDKQRLQKDNVGFYLYRTKRDGEEYKQRVKSNDMLYTRTETGVTKFSENIDRKRPSPKTIYKGTHNEVEPYRHMGDRQAKTSNKIYNV